MRVLLISIGDQILREPDGTVGERLRGYAQRAGNVVQVLYSPADHRCAPTQLSPGLMSYPTRSRSRLLYLSDAAALGRRLLARSRFDLIETQDPVLAGFVGVALARASGVPVVLGCHNDYYGSNAWLTERPRNLAEYATARLALAACDGVRAVSHSLRESAIRLGAPEERVGVAPVPIDRGLFARGRDETPDKRGWSARGRDARSSRILFVGRVDRQKDVPTLIRAVGTLAAWGREVQLDVVGSGTEMESCRTLASHLGIDRRVAFHGRVGPTELSRHYWGCDVFVSPARYEGYGRVLVEAAVHGAPVVATKVGGVPEIVVDGETGVLVRPGDVPALAHAIGGLLEDPVGRAGMARAAWARAVIEFEPGRLSDAVVAFWRRIVDLGPRRGRRLAA